MKSRWLLWRWQCSWGRTGWLCFHWQGKRCRHLWWCHILSRHWRRCWGHAQYRRRCRPCEMSRLLFGRRFCAVVSIRQGERWLRGRWLREQRGWRSCRAQMSSRSSVPCRLNGRHPRLVTRYYLLGWVWCRQMGGVENGRRLAGWRVWRQWYHCWGGLFGQVRSGRHFRYRFLGCMNWSW